MSPPTADDDRRQLADYQTDHGPTHGHTLREALGWTVARFWAAVYDPAGGWFCITKDGWCLTADGERDGPVIRLA